MTPRGLSRAIVLVMLLYAALVLPRMFVPDLGLYSAVLSERVVALGGSAIRLAALLCAWWFARRSVRHYAPEETVRRAWTLLSLGLALYSAAQLILLALTVAMPDPPYPSPADVLFLVATVVLLVALATFARAYREVGLGAESGRGPAVAGAIALLVVGVALAILLGPVVAAGGAPLAVAANLAYPILDGMVLVVTVTLIVIVARFRGGRLWQVCASLLAGFAFLAVGDISYSYFSALEMTSLDPVLDVAYTWAYLLLALGTLLNAELVESDGR